MTTSLGKHVLALSGGVGGAKLALGLARVLEPEQLTVVANTADDFEHLGLSISPDLDTVMYTLAGINNPQQGWGLADETWNAMKMLAKIGGDTWFNLGDRDLATHLCRSQQLAKGDSLSDVTAKLCARLGVAMQLLPMTDDRVRTRVQTDAGELAFQEYFVREQCQPKVRGVYFKGIEQARPVSALMRLLESDSLTGIVICPSNPFVSVAPILALPSLRAALKNCSAPVIAVSPIVAGAAIKGPTAKMMAELNMPTTAAAVAEYYGDLIDAYVLDHADAALIDQIQRPGLSVLAANTVMKSLEDRENLARAIIEFTTIISAAR